MSATATADASWDIVAGLGTQHDSNLYRLSDAVETTSDSVDSTYVGLRLDKQYSQQRFFIDAVTTDFRYQRHDDLDYRGRNIDAYWQWAAGRHFAGKIAVNSSEMISSFADYAGTTRNLRSVDGGRFDVEVLVWARWYLVGSLARQKLENSVVFLEEGDYESDAGEYGVKYQAPSGSNVALTYKVTDGEYANRVVNPMKLIDSGFQQIDAQLRFVWAASGKSRLTGRVGYLEREHDNYGARDFSGAVGSLDYLWDVTGQWQFAASIRQDLFSYQSNPQTDYSIYVYEQLYGLIGRSYFNSSYYESRSFEIGPSWQISAKTSLRLRYKKEERDYEGGLLIGLEKRTDEISQQSASFVWAPIDALSLSLSAQRDERTSSIDWAGFEANIYSANLNFRF